MDRAQRENVEFRILNIDKCILSHSMREARDVQRDASTPRAGRSSRMISYELSSQLKLEAKLFAPGNAKSSSGSESGNS
jgi:hypothetical protein